MALPELDLLLLRIRAGNATPAELDAAKRLVRADERLPEEIRVDALNEEPEIEAGGLLALLGHDDGFSDLLREAVASEDRERVVDVTDDVLQALDIVPDELDAFAVPVGPAIRAEAGEVDLATNVMRTLDLDAEIPLRAALLAEAGDVELGVEVLEALDLDPGPSLAEAVRAEAGTVDVAVRTLAQLGFEALPVADAIRDEAGTVDVTDDVLVAIGVVSLAPSMAVPEPANRPRFAAWGALVLLAAALLLAVLVQGLGGIGPEPTVDAPIAVTEPPENAVAPVPIGVGEMRFASSSEVVVLDLQYGENVQVMQVDGDEGAVILWVEEEAWL